MTDFKKLLTDRYDVILSNTSMTTKRAFIVVLQRAMKADKKVIKVLDLFILFKPLIPMPFRWILTKNRLKGSSVGKICYN